MDDQPLVRNLVASICIKLGYSDIDLAVDGREALEWLRKKPYAFVICDWRMQPMSGLDLLQTVRSDMSLATARFLIMTSQGSVEAVIASKRAGVDGYLIKSFTPETLAEAIKALNTGA